MSPQEPFARYLQYFRDVGRSYIAWLNTFRSATNATLCMALHTPLRHKCKFVHGSIHTPLHKRNFVGQHTPLRHKRSLWHNTLRSDTNATLWVNTLRSATSATLCTALHTPLRHKCNFVGQHTPLRCKRNTLGSATNVNISSSVMQESTENPAKCVSKQRQPTKHKFLCNAMCCNFQHFFKNKATDYRTVLLLRGHIFCPFKHRKQRKPCKYRCVRHLPMRENPDAANTDATEVFRR